MFNITSPCDGYRAPPFHTEALPRAPLPLRERATPLGPPRRTTYTTGKDVTTNAPALAWARHGRTASVQNSDGSRILELSSVRWPNCKVLTANSTVSVSNYQAAARGAGAARGTPALPAGGSAGALVRSPPTCASNHQEPTDQEERRNGTVGLDTDTVTPTVKRPNQAVLSLEITILPPIRHGHRMSVSSPTERGREQGRKETNEETNKETNLPAQTLRR
eukprot:5428019-Pyramimonas_sp.AAC.1